MVCKEHFKGVSGSLLRLYEGSSKRVLKLFLMSFRAIKKIYENFKGVYMKFCCVLRKFQVCFESVSQVIEEGFKMPFKQVSRVISRGFQECPKKFL